MKSPSCLPDGADSRNNRLESMPLSVRPAAAWRSATLVLKIRARPPDRPWNQHRASQTDTAPTRKGYQPGGGGAGDRARRIPGLDGTPTCAGWMNSPRACAPGDFAHAGARREMIVALNHFLFVEQGFAGDTDNFYDPRNSFANEVLDRRRGHPDHAVHFSISKSERLGLELEGISFPFGHFLREVPDRRRRPGARPFSGGTPLDEKDLRTLLDRTYRANRMTRRRWSLLTSAGKKESWCACCAISRACTQHNSQPAKMLNAPTASCPYRTGLGPGSARTRTAARPDGMPCAALADYRHYLTLESAGPSRAGNRPARGRAPGVPRGAPPAIRRPMPSGTPYRNDESAWLLTTSSSAATARFLHRHYQRYRLAP